MTYKVSFVRSCTRAALASREYDRIHRVVRNLAAARYRQRKKEGKVGQPLPAVERPDYSSHYKLRAYMILGGKCEVCGDNRMQALETDHINGGGTRERKILGKSNFERYTRVLQNPEEYQLLCGSCHNIKTSGVVYDPAC